MNLAADGAELVVSFRSAPNTVSTESLADAPSSASSSITGVRPVVISRCSRWELPCG